MYVSVHMYVLCVCVCVCYLCLFINIFIYNCFNTLSYAHKHTNVVCMSVCMYAYVNIIMYV